MDIRCDIRCDRVDDHRVRCDARMADDPFIVLTFYCDECAGPVHFHGLPHRRVDGSANIVEAT